MSYLLLGLLICESQIMLGDFIFWVSRQIDLSPHGQVAINNRHAPFIENHVFIA
jgi:hypothetical protein